LIPLIILNARRGKPLPVYGDGLNVRDWLYVEDHGEAVACSFGWGRNWGDLQHRWLEWKTQHRHCGSSMFDSGRNVQGRIRCYRIDNWSHFVKDRPGHAERYGVVEFDASGESSKPWGKAEASQVPVRGYRLYFCDNDVVQIAQDLKPSERGELEITDVNKVYLQWAQLEVVVMCRGKAWLDTGNHDAMMEAAMFIQTIERRHDLEE
jgi:hypothetical protein